MTSHLTFLTGGSRGMGLALAHRLLHPDRTLVCMARHDNAELAQAAAQAGCTLVQWRVDLSAPSAAAQQMRTWLDGQPDSQFTTATLINNAGMIPQIAPMSDISAADLAQALRVGLEAPMLLTSAFLSATAHWPAERKVLNISSGMGRKPMASQAAYCAAKAGMDHFSRCVALEEALKPHGAKICSLAPGVIDTDMQQQLRGSDSSTFPDAARFAQLKSEGLLSTPQEAASHVLAWLDRPDFGKDPIGDVRHP